MSAARDLAPGGMAAGDGSAQLTRLARVERQAAALAWLPGEPLRLVLVTSRRTRRWVFPKGSIERGYTGPETAAREALEEAGVLGRAEAQPVGRFRSQKVRPPHVWKLEVDVYPLAVEEIWDDWREAHQRTRRFATLEETRELLTDPAMVAIAERFAAGR